MPRNSVARKGTDAHSTLQGAKLLASFRKGGEKQRRVGEQPRSSAWWGAEPGGARAGRNQRRRSELSQRRGHGPDPAQQRSVHSLCLLLSGSHRQVLPHRTGLRTGFQARNSVHSVPIRIQQRLIQIFALPCNKTQH